MCPAGPRPALKELQNVPPAKLRTFFREHHCGREELVEGHLIGIRQAIAAILDRAVIEPKSTVVKVSAQPIRTLVRVFADLGRKIEEAAAHPDFSFLSHYPEQRWRLACWQRLARSESGMATIGKCNRTVGSPW